MSVKNPKKQFRMSYMSYVNENTHLASVSNPQNVPVIRIAAAKPIVSPILVGKGMKFKSFGPSIAQNLIAPATANVGLFKVRSPAAVQQQQKMVKAPAPIIGNNGKVTIPYTAYRSMLARIDGIKPGCKACGRG